MDAAATISSAIESVEDLLCLKSPRDYTVASFPGDAFVEATHGGMLNVDNRVFYFGGKAASHSLYHEAAHWVLMNNGLLFMGKDVFPIYSRALDETLAELCANTLDGKVNDHAVMDIGDARKEALALLLLKKEFEQQAGIYLLHARDEGRADDPFVQATAVHIFAMPIIADLTLKAFELEELFNHDRTKMPEAYQEFQKLWAQQGNWVVERGVASAIGAHAGAMLYEKGHSPRNILQEINKERGSSPMQLYWQVIVPKL